MDTQIIKREDGTSEIAFPYSRLNLERHKYYGDNPIIRPITKENIRNGMNIRVGFVQGRSTFVLQGTIADRSESNDLVSMIARHPVKNELSTIPNYELVGFEVNLKSHTFRSLGKGDVERLVDRLSKHRDVLEEKLREFDKLVQQNEERDWDDPCLFR